jgi:hypothetical protein
MTQNDSQGSPQSRVPSSAAQSGKPVNNKEGRPFAHYLEKYRTLDPLEAAARCGVSYDPDAGVFLLSFIANRYAVSFPDFSVLLLEKKVPADQLTPFGAAQILILRYLLEGRSTPALGKYLTYREMPWGNVYNDNFTGRCIKRLAFSYGNALETFSGVMEALGATRIKGGDAAYELELMNGLFVRYLLWSGDEEFPPSAQILFSDNFSDAFTAEDMAVVGDVTINAMKEVGKLL